MRNKQSTYRTLKAWRAAKKLRQVDAAAQLGVTQWQYSRFETRAQAPRPKCAKAISLKTGVPLESVLGL